MDYVKEELLRQRKALENLLSGDMLRMEPEEMASREEALPSAERRRERVRGAVLPAERESTGRARGRRDLVVSLDERRTLNRLPAEAELQAWEGAAFHAFTSERPQTEARELSRTFQRDARRYDGGFSMY